MKNVITLILGLLLLSCNKDDYLTLGNSNKPVIEFDNNTGVYTVKVGRELTISPSYQYAEDAVFSWTIDGKLVSTNPSLTYSWSEAGDIYIILRVDNENGFVQEEIKVEVTELLPPAINLYIPAKGIKVQQGKPYTFTPDITNKELDDFKIEWIRDNEIVSRDSFYVFNESIIGIYPITLKASNEDGENSINFDVEVVENMPYNVHFPTPYYFASSTNRYTFWGRPVYLYPIIDYFECPQYKWEINGKIVENANERTYAFTPISPGEYNITVMVTEERNGVSVESTVKVVCVNGNEHSLFRAPTEISSAYSNKVYEYLPAPGQFVNETSTGGFTGTETTNEGAIEYANKRLVSQNYVSLGSFGGYIIVGFDHSVRNNKSNNYDFSIQGNAFDSSNEPGVVWVMQDVNGNGLPDDEWYELKGSETGKHSTVQNYEVTYFRPSSPKTNVYWIDNLGNKGYVEHNIYHQQDTYYPLWIKESSYTLIGTRLLPRNEQSSTTGYWSNNPYDWGYVDNWGNDVLSGDSYDGSGQKNGFKISNAIFPDGSPARLEYIDFIKVQCGVLAKSGVLGEISTEVFSFQDLYLTNK